jgi:hypothetical protein
MLVPCDLNSPRDIQVHHPGVVEETFHSCSLHLHVLLTFFSVEKKSFLLANKLKFAPFRQMLATQYMQTSLCQ